MRGLRRPRHTFHDLDSWMATAGELARRDILRKSRFTIDALRLHWIALDYSLARLWIDGESDPAPLARFESMLHRRGSLNSTVPWGKPGRGNRGGTKWEMLNMAVKNRLWKLSRDADAATMGIGHNSKNALST